MAFLSMMAFHSLSSDANQLSRNGLLARMMSPCDFGHHSGMRYTSASFSKTAHRSAYATWYAAFVYSGRHLHMFRSVCSRLPSSYVTSVPFPRAYCMVTVPSRHCLSDGQYLAMRVPGDRQCSHNHPCDLGGRRAMPMHAMWYPRSQPSHNSILAALPFELHTWHAMSSTSTCGVCGCVGCGCCTPSVLSRLLARVDSVVGTSVGCVGSVEPTACCTLPYLL